MKTSRLFHLTLIVTFITFFSFPAVAQSKKHKVLVVMSYEQNNPWCIEIKEGIETVLAAQAELTYFYMDTKINFAGGVQKAKEAYSLLHKLQPDGVIAVDDNAQQMFVLPFLKDKVKIPIMFCGVNREAERYGYPTINISGVLERGHIKASISLAKQLSPSIKTVGFFAKDSPSGVALHRQVEGESASYITTVSAVELLKTTKELLVLAKKHKEISDAIFIDSLEGILEENGTSPTNFQLIKILSKEFGKPIIGANLYHVSNGALCAVVKTGQEQGNTAATMLLQSLQGTPVADIPITRNYQGKRVINVTVMNELGIKPRPIVLLGTDLVKTSK